ncbi:MAG: putative 2-aminoethylphosphonate ABC transporter ATP-binding protein [Alphaproteobacteria bacterium]|nr:putative 2-aminoethylphosphonate ABC transporter ATP-binding protein [Alphaproteobacteria bacterium]
MKTSARPVSQPYLQLTNITKRYGSFTALQSVDLTIHEGEFICFLGPSGCGKTTLLRVISGLDIQSEGTVIQAGRDISGLPVSHRDFGIVFQSYALFPNLTVEANVGYGLTSRRMKRREIAARVGELLTLVGLTDQRRKYPPQLSGGQQQRVALARALALSPGLLLLDEPLSALDARVRLRLRTEIRDLQQRLGLTTIMVTHDQEEALAMADRIVVMNAGRIDQVGTPLEVYSRPATPFVADFVGKMNFKRGRLGPDRRVTVDGVELVYAPDPDLRAQPGEEVVLCLRPEDIVVRGISETAPNRLAVRVLSMEFIGNHFHLRLGILGSELVLEGDLSINAVRDLSIEVGRGLTIALPPDRLRIFAQGTGR